MSKQQWWVTGVLLQASVILIFSLGISGCGKDNRRGGGGGPGEGPGGDPGSFNAPTIPGMPDAIEAGNPNAVISPVLRRIQGRWIRELSDPNVPDPQMMRIFPVEDHVLHGRMPFATEYTDSGLGVIIKEEGNALTMTLYDDEPRPHNAIARERVFKGTYDPDKKEINFDSGQGESFKWELPEERYALLNTSNLYRCMFVFPPAPAGAAQPGATPPTAGAAPRPGATTAPAGAGTVTANPYNAYPPAATGYPSGTAGSSGAAYAPTSGGLVYPPAANAPTRGNTEELRAPAAAPVPAPGAAGGMRPPARSAAGPHASLDRAAWPRGAEFGSGALPPVFFSSITLPSLSSSIGLWAAAVPAATENPAPSGASAPPRGEVPPQAQPGLAQGVNVPPEIAATAAARYSTCGYMSTTKELWSRMSGAAGQ